jgi:putative ATPase
MPLAYRMRPQNIDEVVGQAHLVGPGKIIRRMIEAGMLSSMILYGPPGTGKTSIASAIAGSTEYAFRILNAATDTKKDMQAVVDEAEFSGSLILLLDEIHRLDKPKQDFLLPHLESGKIVLIGATTENPYISIAPAIRSRSQIFKVEPLAADDIVTALLRAVHDKKRGLGSLALELDDVAIDFMSHSTDGDLRSVLNALELAAKSTPVSDEDGKIHITAAVMEECLQRKSFMHDKDGDAHYDVISAFQKSIRGSDVDAAMHYMARLVEAGELQILCRRLLVIASEDIGLANPGAAERTLTCVLAAEKLGFPEARIPLAQAVIDLCLSPKSNSAVVAIDAALADVRAGRSGKIPDNLRDTHYSGAEKNGAKGYIYPHGKPNNFVKQQYIPETLDGAHYYFPNTSGKYESALAERQKFLDSL